MTNSMTQTGPKRHGGGLVVATLAAMIAVACGGGGGGGSTAGVGSGGTGFVTGFGSVIVDGVAYEDSALDTTGAIRVEELGDDRRAVGRDGNRARLRVGQRLELQLSDDGASVRSALISSEITGPVTQVSGVNGTSFRVVNQVVNINTDPAIGPVTVFEGASALSDFALGDRVEVHGDVRTDGAILASRIERKPNLDSSNQPIALVKISGLISALNGEPGSTRTFTVGGTQVSLPADRPVTPTPATLSNGQRVKVFGTFANNVVTADAVRIKRFNQALGDFRLRGLVSSLTSQTAFTINNIVVDASGIAPADRPTIVVNQAYRVRGIFTPAAEGASTGGTLKATEIKTSNDEAVRNAELKGSVTEFVSVSNFRVRGVLVDATGVTPTPASCTLGNGQFVEVKGAVNQPSATSNAESRVIATQVKCENAPRNGSELKLTNTVSNLNTSAKTFNLGQQLVAYASAQFDDGTVTDLVNGALVEVEGRLNGGTLNAREIEFKRACGTACASGRPNDDSDDDASEDNDQELKGVLAQDATQANGSDQVTFTLAGINLSCTSGSFGNLCTTTRLRKGLRLEAEYINRNGVNQVTRLKQED